jgi:hypothetical protein
MRRRVFSTSLVAPSLSIFLLASIPSTRALHAQAAGPSISIRLLDAIDSSRDPAGRQYRASVAKAVDTANGAMIPQGAPAAVSLAGNGASGWTTQLVSVTVNGQQVAVSSGPAIVTSAAQSAAGAAVSSMNSVLGGFGRHVNTPAAATAIATGQRVVLPPGATLNFVLTQPAPVAVAPAAAAPNVAVASAPVAPETAPSSQAPAAASGQHWYMCQYLDPKNLDKPAAGSFVYFSYFPTSDSALASQGGSGGMAYSSALLKHFIGYVRQNHKVADLPGNPSAQYNGRSGGRCNRVQDNAAARANGRDLFLKGAKTNNMEPLEVDFADTAAQDAAIDAKLPGGAQPAPPPVVNSKECAYHATCSSQVPKL